MTVALNHPMTERATANHPTADRVTAFVEELRVRGIQQVRFEFPDLHGASRSKLVPIDAVEGFSRKGLNFYGGMMGLDSSSLIVPETGLHQDLNYRDGILLPDFDTLTSIPWLEGNARVICDYQWSADEPVTCSPRYVYQQVIQKAADMGFDIKMGQEFEFYLLNAQTRQPVFEGVHAFNTLRNQYLPIIDDLLKQLLAAGLDLIDHGCEYGPGQMEINYGPAIGMKAVDKSFVFRQIVKEYCQRSGYLATFMSRPFSDQCGCGCHVHVCLLDRKTGENIFLDPGAPHGLSNIARSFIQGILNHGPGMMPLIAPTPNCYRRYIPPTFVSMYRGWGIQDRTGMVRVKATYDEDTHLEMRAASSISNPYLSAAATVAAGLLGIQEGLILQPPIEGQGLSDNPGYAALPSILDEALESLEADSPLCALLGEEFVRVFAAVKRAELLRFKAHVSDWEKAEYMEMY
jgi:glutamine synthetase